MAVDLYLHVVLVPQVVPALRYLQQIDPASKYFDQGMFDALDKMGEEDTSVDAARALVFDGIKLPDGSRIEPLTCNIFLVEETSFPDSPDMAMVCFQRLFESNDTDGEMYRPAEEVRLLDDALLQSLLQASRDAYRRLQEVDKSMKVQFDIEPTPIEKRLISPDDLDRFLRPCMGSIVFLWTH